MPAFDDLADFALRIVWNIIDTFFWQKPGKSTSPLQKEAIKSSQSDPADPKFMTGKSLSMHLKFYTALLPGNMK